MSKIQPVSGFPEWSPSEQMLYNHYCDIIRKHYERFGFVPLRTPLVERVETLTSKGGEAKEIYGLRRLMASEELVDESKLALRFDHTVPLARFVVQNSGTLTFPFRRYSMGPVFRGERPQDGRYRQFDQIDIDIIGRETLPLLCDAEVVAVIASVFQELSFGDFVIRINNRKIFQGMFEDAGIDKEQLNSAMRAVDKIEKIGKEKVIDELVEIGMTSEKAQNITKIMGSSGTTDELLDMLRNMDMGELFAAGVKDLTEVVQNVRALGVDEGDFHVDLSIARGLDYYTGTVYETRLVAHPEIGSICSGGRYEELTEVFGGKKFPGVGISIGLSRLFGKLLKTGIIKGEKHTTAQVLVLQLDKQFMMDYLGIAAELRKSGVNTEVYPEQKKFDKQMKFANKKGFETVVIMGEDEVAAGTVIIKDMASRKQKTVARQDILRCISA